MSVTGLLPPSLISYTMLLIGLDWIYVSRHLVRIVTLNATAVALLVETRVATI